MVRLIRGIDILVVVSSFNFFFSIRRLLKIDKLFLYIDLVSPLRAYLDFFVSATLLYSAIPFRSSEIVAPTSFAWAIDSAYRSLASMPDILDGS